MRMDFISKNHWPSYLILAYILLAFVLAYAKMADIAVVAGIAVAAIVAYRYETSRESLEKLWPMLAIVLVVSLSVFVRIADYRWPYLRNIDSYAFYRQMEMIVEYGKILPEDPFYFNPPNHVLQPEGFSFPWYQWLGAYSYMFSRLFSPGLQLWQYLIYFPAVLVSLAAVPMYYIGKLLYDRKAGVMAAFFVVFDLSNVSRSLGGDPDNDAAVILVPLLVFAFFLFAYGRISNSGRLDRKAILYSVITGALLFVWHNTWAGYFYSIWLMAGLLAAKTVARIVHTRNAKTAWDHMKPYAFSFLIIIFSFFIIDYPIFGFSSITDAIIGPIFYQNIKSEEISVFPNVYVSVAELQASGGIREIITRVVPVGGPAILISPVFLTLFALIYLGYAYVKHKKYEDAFFVIMMWFMGPFIASLVAVRFTMLFAAPMALGAAIFLSKAWRMASGESKNIGE